MKKSINPNLSNHKCYLFSSENNKYGSRFVCSCLIDSTNVIRGVDPYIVTHEMTLHSNAL